MARSGQALDEFAQWVAPHRSPDWVLAMLKYLPMSALTREDLAALSCLHQAVRECVVGLAIGPKQELTLRAAPRDQVELTGKDFAAAGTWSPTHQQPGQASRTVILRC